MPSALRDARSALFTIFTATFADTATRVFNGPRVRSEQPKHYLLVGVNGIDELEAGMRAAQLPSPMSGTWRDESGEVDCTAVAWTGDSDMDAIRAAAEAIVDSCEAAINTNPSLSGLLVPANNFAELTRLDIREQRTDKGPFVEAVFTVSYSTTLTS